MKIQRKVNSIIDDLSQARFTPYVSPHRSQIDGLRAYRYNIIVSQSVWEATAIFEVLLRNRIVKEWNQWFSVNGFKNCEWPLKIKSLHNQLPHKFPKSSFNNKALESLEKQEAWAFQRATREIKTRNVINDDIIARLTFGFWHECLSHHFRFISGSQIKGLFPHYPYQHTYIEHDMADIAKDLQSIKDFRNRLAHHEKLDINKTKQKYIKICQYITYINPNAIKLVSVDGFNHLLNSPVNKVTRNFPYL